MKARKLKSGKWNARAYIGKDSEGKSLFRSFTADTKAEALRLAALNTFSGSKDMTVEQTIVAYLNGKKAVLSPTTFRGYMGIYHANIKDSDFATRKISQLNNRMVQLWISTVSESHSPKTVKNIYGLFCASVKHFFPSVSFDIKLPQNRQPKLHTPTTEEVKTIISIAKKKKNKELYKAILLGAIGMMRQGEIAALTAGDCDFRKNTIRITKSMARDINNEWVIKPPKNDASNRVVIMPKFVMDELPRKGRIVNLNTGLISEYFKRLVKQSGLPHFRFHDLRHYAASIAASSSVGASVEAIKARGGWATDGMMKRIYINQLGDEVDKDTKMITDYYEQKFDC